MLQIIGLIKSGLINGWAPVWVTKEKGVFNLKLIIEVGGKMYEWIGANGCGLEGVMNE